MVTRAGKFLQVCATAGRASTQATIHVRLPAYRNRPCLVSSLQSQASSSGWRKNHEHCRPEKRFRWFKRISLFGAKAPAAAFFKLCCAMNSSRLSAGSTIDNPQNPFWNDNKHVLRALAKPDYSKVRSRDFTIPMEVGTEQKATRQVLR